MNTFKQLIEKYCPDGVEYKKLGEIFDYFSGMTGVSGKWKETGNCKFIDYLNVYNNMRVDVTALKNATVTNQRQNILRKDDILLTCASETPNECALSSVIRDDIEDNTFLDDHLFALRVKQEFKEIIDTAFLNYYFHSIESRKAVNKTVRGVTRFYISYPSFMKIEIPVPPLPVQSEIVRILDNFTSLEAELEAELEARRKQYEYYRDQLLSFKHLTGGGSNEVEWKTLGEVFIMKAGIHINANEINASQTTAYQYPCYGGNGIRGYVKRSNQIGSSAIIGRQGALCGNVKYVDKLYYATEHAVVVKPKEEVDMKWAFYKLQQMNLNQYKSQGAQPGLAVGKLEELKIPVPPLSVQHRIVSILDRFESLVNDISSGLPAEIAARHQQYEYYRDQLLTFKRKS